MRRSVKVPFFYCSFFIVLLFLAPTRFEGPPTRAKDERPSGVLVGVLRRDCEIKVVGL